jgi:hypothetical protein
MTSLTGFATELRAEGPPVPAAASACEPAVRSNVMLSVTPMIRDSSLTRARYGSHLADPMARYCIVTPPEIGTPTYMLFKRPLGGQIWGQA